MSKHAVESERPSTDFKCVFNSQVLASAAFSHDILQHCCPRGVRDIVVEREGEGEVSLVV